MTWSSTATRGVTGPRRPLRGLGGFGSLAFSIPLGLSAGRPLSPFSRAISARWAATVCSRAATLPSNLTTNAFSSVGESASRSPGGAIPPENQRQACQGSENHAAASVLPLLLPDRSTHEQIRASSLRQCHTSFLQTMSAETALVSEEAALLIIVRALTIGDAFNHYGT